MRYSLRTLVIATAVGPVVGALIYFGAIWLWNVLPEVASSFNYPAMLAVMAITVGLSGYSLFAPPADTREFYRPVLWMTPIVAGCQILALWIGLSLLFNYLGWICLWGDNQGPQHETWVNAWAGVAATLLAANVTIRSLMGLATRTYLVVNTILAVAILITLAPLYLARWLR